MAADSDSQVPIFLDRLRTLFHSSDEEGRGGEDPNRGTALAVCVLLSFVLWLSLTLQEQRMVGVEFPVEVGGVPEDRALVELPPSTVTVQLRGTGLDLIGLMFDPPSIPVQADQERANMEEALDLPRGSEARIENITPRVIEVKTEPRVERRLPIRSRIDVRTDEGYELIDDPTIAPDSLTIFGARSIVNDVSAWPTDSLALTNIRDTVRRTVPLRDTLRGLVERSTEEVTVVARAGQFSVETEEVTVEVTGVPAGQDLVALQPSTIRIRYRVLFSQLFAARRSSSEFFATVSYSQIRSDTTGYVKPQIHVPSDLVIRDPEAIPPRLRYYTYLSRE